MKIYKFLQKDGWPVLILAGNKAKAKYALYRFAQAMSIGGYNNFCECLKTFDYVGTISYEDAQKLIDAEECDADFEIHQFERAGR
jgi:hypothetical protein